MDILDLIYDHHVTKKREQQGRFSSQDSNNDTVVVADQEQIIQIITLLTAESKNPVIVNTEKEIFDYHSYLKLNNKNSPDSANIVLIVDALDPPIGNVRIRVSSSIIIRIFSKRFCFELPVQLLAVMSDQFKMSLPQQIGIQKEKRSSVRVKVDPRWDIIVEATRMAGVTFPLKIDNIGLGGLCFFCSGQTPGILKGLQVQFNLLWPSKGIELNFSVHVVESSILKEDEKCRYHARYRFENYNEIVRSLEKMVTDMQREMLVRREKRFVSW